MREKALGLGILIHLEESGIPHINLDPLIVINAGIHECFGWGS